MINTITYQYNNLNMNYIFLILILFIGLQYVNNINTPQYPLSDIETKIKLDNNYFESIYIYSNQKTAYFNRNTTLSNDTNIKIYTVKYEDYTYFIERINNLYTEKTIPILFHDNINIIDFMFNAILKIGLIFMVVLMVHKLYSYKSKLNTIFGKVAIKMYSNDHIKFDDVIGLKSVVKELKEYANFIKHRQVYLKYGYNIPRGLLFVGPPGTGKTYLSKAIANESGANFLSVCGSDFIEIFVGNGSKRIRELFETARKENKPCIIFIDEIDTIGQKRSVSLNSNEHNSTLNSLLVEMDGFSSTDNILVIGSTNRCDILDPALTRSGRFDKKIVFESPNIDERVEMFKLYLNKVKQSDDFKTNFDVNIKNLAKQTAGLNGADIKNIVNQSVYNFLEKHDDKTNINDTLGITYNDVHKSIDDIMIGMEKPERKMSEDEIKRVAIHEAGHAVISYMLSTTTSPSKISIIPRGYALGYNKYEPTDKRLYDANELTSKIMTSFGGRCAEELFLKSISSGCNDDMQKIDNIVEILISNCRMKSFGYVDILKDNKWNNIIIKNILTKLYNKTYKILKNNKKSVEKL